MTDPRPHLYFDFVDPVSFLLAKALESVPSAASLLWVPFEAGPPPSPLVSIEHPSVVRVWERARSVVADADSGVGPIEFAPPHLVPWTRKAHELVAHAPENRRGALRARVFEAYMLEGVDIGRVDVLVDIAADFGLDRTETKAVLDVDRYQGEVSEARSHAIERGIGVVPTLVLGEERLEGFHNRTVLGTFLRTVAHDDPDPNTLE